MDTLKAINSRRSVRSFKPDSVPREDLERIVSAAIEAPSGVNKQLRKYVIVDDPKVLDGMRDISRALEDAPAAIVIVMNPEPTKFGEFWVQDASAAMENILLAATSLGYGSCWIEGALRRHEDSLKKLLNIPETLRAWSLTPIGKPREESKRPEKSAFDDVTFYNRFK